MLVLIELVLLLVVLGTVSFFTVEKGQVILFDRVVSPIILSLISIVLGILLTIPIFIRQIGKYRKKLRGMKKENKEIKKVNKEMKKDSLDLFIDDK